MASPAEAALRERRAIKPAATAQAMLSAGAAGVTNSDAQAPAVVACGGVATPCTSVAEITINCSLMDGIEDAAGVKMTVIRQPDGQAEVRIYGARKTPRRS